MKRELNYHDPKYIHEFLCQKLIDRSNLLPSFRINQRRHQILEKDCKTLRGMESRYSTTFINSRKKCSRIKTERKININVPSTTLPFFNAYYYYTLPPEEALKIHQRREIEISF